MTRRVRRRPRLPTRLTVRPLEDRLAPAVVLGQQPGAPNTTQFHADPARSGFYQNETVLTPANVAAGFGQVWQSPVLDGHLYASPLYQDSVLIQGAGNAANHAGDGVQSPSFQGQTLGAVFAATGGGTVYAVAAQDTNGTTGIAPGTILWKTHLGNSYAGIDGNSIGVLGTPIIDVKSGRLYVTASVTDYLLPAGNPNHGGNNFEVFALNIKDGSLVAGWPLVFTQSLLDSLNQNTLNGAGVAVPFSSAGADQRGALALSNDGSTLYVDWACYGSSNPGWMTTVATGVTNGVSNGQTATIVSAYSGVDSTAVLANAGMWGAGGPAVDAAGNVFVSTGDSPPSTGQLPGSWGNSVLEFGPGQTLALTGVYTPWNYQTQDTIDSDLGGGSPILINLPAGSSTTTELLAVGGKQGNGYLVDAGNHLNNPTPNPTSPAPYPASLTVRPPVVAPNQDPSLWDPNANRSYFSPAQPGPLALFGPYNETSASGNTAKARDTPATFVGPDGNSYVVWAGSSKAGVGSGTPVAPSLFLTQVVATPGQPAYLQIVGQNTQVMSNPGANIITGNGTTNEIVWIVDSGVQRTDPLTSFANGAPTLYAYDALTMKPLWSSAYQQLDMGGKYNTVAAARGQVFVGTDRVQAFGLTPDTIVDDAVTGTGANQFNYVGSGWAHTPAGTSTSTMGTFGGTVSTDTVAGDFATLTFTGSRIKVYANETSGYGGVTVTVDGGNSQTVSLANATNSPNGAGEGDVLIYTLAGLGAGQHTLKIVNNGTATVGIDRVVISPLASASSSLGVSLTEGNVTPALGGVLPYTINFNNFGSVVDGTGTNATGVVLTETVPANTTADLADSTPGWTLFSGSGGPGAVYKFAAGSFAAGSAASVVFSVTVNASLPAGTTSLTNTVTITDAAGDTQGGMRVTPIGNPAAASLVFTQQPGDGETGVALAPPVAVTVRDQYGHTFTGQSSTVTLTLNGGTFAGGGNTATANTVNGVATFNSLVVASAGTFTLTASDGALAGATSGSFKVQTPTRMAFTTQPPNGIAGSPLTPAVTVAVQDAGGATVTGDASTVTLTLNGGTFAGGGNTATATALRGVATFANLVITATGNYTLTATDGGLTPDTSATFSVSAGTSVYVDFDAGVGDFTSNFTVNNNGGANNTSLAWGAGLGVQDQPGPAAGGGVQSAGGVAIDSTAVYTPSRVNLSDGATHTVSAFVTATTGLGLGGGDKPLQVGYLASGSAGFNSGFSFISARILGNNTAEFQYCNGTGSATSTNNTAFTGTVAAGDWLDLILTTREAASGSFQGTFTVIDYGQSGFGPGTTVLGPVSYTVTGLTTLGTAANVSPGFRSALPASFAGHVRYDNFAVDPAGPAELDYLRQPTAGTAGSPLTPSFVVALEDLHNHIIATDNSLVTLVLSHDTFANGATSVSAQAVNGVATFSNLTINLAGSYILRATDANPDLDPDYAPFTIAPSTPNRLQFFQQPVTASSGAAIAPAPSVQIVDQYGNLTTSTALVGVTVSGPGTFAAGSVTSVNAVGGVATFGTLILTTPGSYQLSASSGGVTGTQSVAFTVVPFGVTAVTPTATGVAVAFNKPLDPTVLNLYDQGGQWGPADLTLVGPNGSIRGSLVLTASAAAPAGQFDGATFVATGGSTAASAANSVLPAGPYTLTLNSGPTAFKDLAGNALNGGANYTTTFTVSAPPAEVLSLPSFVRGAGQPVRLPTDTAAGLPVYLSDATGVGSVALSFTYDNTLLAVTGFTPNPAIPGVASTFQTSAGGATTTVTVTVTGTAAFTGTPGAFTLGNFAAAVPSTAPYGAKAVLHVASLAVKSPAGATLPSAGADGIQVAAYVADNHADRNYSPSDITLENRLFLGAVTGFVGTPAAPTFPLADPELLGSITGNGNVGGSDITQLNRAFLGFAVPNLPPVPSLGTPPPNGIDPRLFIPTTATARPGQTITVPVNLEVTDPRGLAAGLAADGLVVRYDPTVLTFRGIQAGSLFADPAGGFGAYATNAGPGLVRAVVTSARGTGPLAHGTVGSVALLTFTVAATARRGRSVLNLEASDGVTTTAVVGNDFRTLVLSPAPTNGWGDAVDGAVTIVPPAPPENPNSKPQIPTDRIADLGLSAKPTAANRILPPVIDRGPSAKATAAARYLAVLDAFDGAADELAGYPRSGSLAARRRRSAPWSAADGWLGVAVD